MNRRWMIITGAVAAVLVLGILMLLFLRSGEDFTVLSCDAHNGDAISRQTPEDLENPPGSDRIPVKTGFAGGREAGDPEESEFDPDGPPAWHFRGRVTDEEGRPVAGARVILILDFDSYIHHDTLAPVFTDAEGRYSATAALRIGDGRFVEAGKLHLHVGGEADAKGFLSAWVSEAGFLDFSRTRPAIMEIDFEMERGAVLRGVVYRPDGSSARGALVSVWSIFHGHYSFDAIAGPEGGYIIPLPLRRGGEYRIGAGDPRLGISPLLPIVIDPERDLEVPPLRIRPGHVISGTVRFPDGTPASDIFVHAYPAGDSDLPVEALSRHVCTGLEDSCPDGETCFGLISGAVASGPDGSFRIVGLRGGDTFLRASGFCFVGKRWSLVGETSGSNQDYSLDFESWTVENRVLCRAGDSGVDLVVDLHVLELTVTDARGRPYPAPRVQVSHSKGTALGTAAAGFFVCQVSPGPVRITTLAKDDGRGTFAFRLVTDLVIESGCYHTRAHVVLCETRYGEVELLLTDTRGNPFVPLSSFAVIAGKPTSQEFVALQCDKLETGAKGGRLLRLPAGNWPLKIFPTDRSLEMFARKKTVAVDVVPGKTITVEMPVEEWGRFGFTITEACGKKTLNCVRSTTNPGGRAGSSNVHYVVNLVSLDRPDTVYLHHFATPEKHRTSSVFRIGVPYVSRAIVRPGMYRMEIEPYGFPLTTTIVEIKEGRTTEVAFGFSE
jgi:hypothetical protein